ncbi:outer membrane beta-barrel protein [Gemmatimonadota bacterium]
MAVVLVPEGEVSEACTQAEEDPDCECERLGTIFWGEAQTIDINIAETGATMEVGRGPVQVTGPTVNIGVGAGGSWFENLEETACSGPDCEVDDFGTAIFGFVEYTWRKFRFGAEGGHSDYSVSQGFEAVPGLPATSDTDVDLWWVSPYVGATGAVGELVKLYCAFGAAYLWNIANTISSASLLGQAVEEDRSESGVRISLDLGIDLRIARSAGVRLGYRLVAGDEGDADKHHRGSMGLFMILGQGR